MGTTRCWKWISENILEGYTVYWLKLNMQIEIIIGTNVKLMVKWKGVVRNKVCYYKEGDHHSESIWTKQTYS